MIFPRGMSAISHSLDEHKTLAVDHLAVLHDRHVDAGAALKAL